MESARRVKLDQVIPRRSQRITFQYDFGDEWQHYLVVEQMLLRNPGTRYPVCPDGCRACPPEDCGGLEAMLNF